MQPFTIENKSRENMVLDQAKPIVVTEDNFGGLLVAAMEEAAQIACGDRRAARTVRRARHERSRPADNLGRQR
jgi:hypothetical protein